MAPASPIRYVESDGLQIAYQVVGDGPTDLVYVPGIANHIEAMWDIPEIARFTEQLASFSRLILIDKRGTGLSDRLPTDQRATVEERMHDVQAVLDATGSTSAFLFATADGTPVALLAGAVSPDRVRGLALWAASARLLEDEDYPIGFPDAAAEALLAGFAAMSAIDVHVRAGVHTGEIEFRREDIAGLAVHIGARVASLAASDEIIVSGLFDARSSRSWRRRTGRRGSSRRAA